ncbi:MAG: SDR family oxidoreductase [Ignavibacteriae bacterium]|nr:SDR family oxidoreductase [Ignavibacteriota bacterium]NOG97662.1 SDR family oxidoreductase [Ignavibacteriota bacterium]
MSMKNGAIWITGASSGIGRETAIKFLRNGYFVAASARRKELLTSLQQFTDDKNESRLLPIDLDISDFEAVNKTADKINRAENVSCLINNAGITTFSPAIENTNEEVKQIIDINLSGSIFAIQAVLPAMIKHGKGTIINIISVAADKVFTNSSVYSASKAGLLAYANVLREEVREHNIKVINVLPGATKTPIWPNEQLEKFSERMMSPADIAKLLFDFYETEGSLVPEEVTIRPIKGDI